MFRFTIFIINYKIHIMKTIIASILLIITCNLKSQVSTIPVAIKMATFTVKGNCEQCKERIENAADLKGVKYAKWDKKAQILSVTYKPEKITVEQIEKAIAASGHDAGEFKAGDESYKKLPKCCKYREGKCEK